MAYYEIDLDAKLENEKVGDIHCPVEQKYAVWSTGLGGMVEN